MKTKQRSYFFLKTFSCISSLSILSVLPISIVSCSNDNNVGRYTTSDIGGIKQTINTFQTKNIIEYAQENPQAVNKSTILITCGGKVNDLSFNQSVWEALSYYSILTNNKNNTFFETPFIDDSSMFQGYDYALNKGYNYWILTGFQQEGYLLKWLQIGQNFQRFMFSNAKIITVDWYVAPPSTTQSLKEQVIRETLLSKGKILGLNFKTQESSYIIAYAICNYLSNKFPNDPSKRIMTSFAGGDFSGATNFNYGFYQGILDWNIECLNDPTKTKKPIRVPIYNKEKNEYVCVSAGFDINDTSRGIVDSIVNGAIGGNDMPTVIFPVAGPLTAQVVDKIKDKKSNQYVIGVDTDQSKAFKADAKKFITSSEKRIAITIFYSMLAVSGMLDERYGLPPTLIPSFQSFFNNQSINIIGGINENFVGCSKSTIEDGATIDKLIEESKARFETIGPNSFTNQINFLQQNLNIVNEPIPTDPPNPSASTLFKIFLNDPQNQSTNIFNIKVCGLTFDNKLNYFKPVVQLINKSYEDALK